MSEKPGSVFDFCGCSAVQLDKYINNIKSDSQIICEWKSDSNEGESERYCSIY